MIIEKKVTVFKVDDAEYKSYNSALKADKINTIMRTLDITYPTASIIVSNEKEISEIFHEYGNGTLPAYQPAPGEK